MSRRVAGDELRPASPKDIAFTITPRSPALNLATLPRDASDTPLLALSRRVLSLEDMHSGFERTAGFHKEPAVERLVQSGSGVRVGGLAREGDAGLEGSGVECHIERGVGGVGVDVECTLGMVGEGAREVNVRNYTTGLPYTM